MASNFTDSALQNAPTSFFAQLIAQLPKERLQALSNDDVLDAMPQNSVLGITSLLCFSVILQAVTHCEKLTTVCIQPAASSTISMLSP